eukprot:12906290-Alexandrium_andersonii.AAC.1
MVMSSAGLGPGVPAETAEAPKRQTLAAFKQSALENLTAHSAHKPPPHTPAPQRAMRVVEAESNQRQSNTGRVAGEGQSRNPR